MKCRTCGATLRPWIEGEEARGYKGDGVFCTASCGYEYGLAAATKHVPARSPLDEMIAREAMTRRTS